MENRCIEHRQVHVGGLDQQIVLVADGGLVELKSGLGCAGYAEPVTCISRLQLNARLFDPPPVRPARRSGRKQIVGPRQPKPADWLADPAAPWPSLAIDWYAKSQATFSDVLVFVRFYLWTEVRFSRVLLSANSVIIPFLVLHDMLDDLCFAP